jgi:hypothetical protein
VGNQKYAGELTKTPDTPKTLLLSLLHGKFRYSNPFSSAQDGCKINQNYFYNHLVLRKPKTYLTSCQGHKKIQKYLFSSYRRASLATFKALFPQLRIVLK